MDRPHDDHSGDDTADRPAMPTQAELEVMLDADEADLAAGRVMPSEPVMARMRATADRLRRERQLKKATDRQD